MTPLEARIRESFSRQRLMQTLGISLARVERGEVELQLGFDSALTQQHGYLHAGVVTSMLDSAAGYAALSTMPEGKEVVSVEFKVNLMSPAEGERFRAVGKVARAGRTLTVCTAELFAARAGEERVVALLQGTMFAVDAG